MPDMNPKWIVWKEGGGAPTFMHPLQEDAEREAERLARTIGGTFHVAQIVASCKRVDLEWSRVPLEMPF